ncbi:hypothetical protein [Clostridium saccharobutylicum]|uniref:Uncharacterized protein n=1 Tax=Clostridium saccharobutylicum DSM 13864 TaxID=1345695 RepID=U5MTH7_CLOSA|nr:hypothetical protein [Clostridium saccharobutylicum]AGX42941.1 hypothetical protein CLSA_c19570 [Clostridium saccharobutylicum DSM 13864]AQR90234.1 hypothetical protein CLOSC_19490 [Clostridium saccharobutylicum]AQS00140.1 hypothetical protein CSACC_19560 [Clostridium saccharobutylicum]AQS09937.1 hypothetical protein CLOBY_20760 [Clostridium saccharobutylicum]AQS14123.1 hypothetical protein CLOSACC_19560 [Clostridium saccharobutylicum]
MSSVSLLAKQLNKAAENLSVENRKIFDDIIIYIRTSNLKERDAEEFLQQILDSFLNAQQQGVSIESMIGTTDIRHYCEEIVNTYKSSYNFLSRSSQYIMYTGIFIVILSFTKYILQKLTPILFKTHELNNFTFYLDFNLQLIIQCLIVIPFSVIILASLKKTCFKGTSKFSKVKEYFTYWMICVLLICTWIAIFKFVDETVIFSLNIFIVLSIGSVIYFIGNYFTEK